MLEAAARVAPIGLASKTLLLATCAAEPRYFSPRTVGAEVSQRTLPRRESCRAAACPAGRGRGDPSAWVALVTVCRAWVPVALLCACACVCERLCHSRADYDTSSDPACELVCEAVASSIWQSTSERHGGDAMRPLILPIGSLHPRTCCLLCTSSCWRRSTKSSSEITDTENRGSPRSCSSPLAFHRQYYF